MSAQNRYQISRHYKTEQGCATDNNAGRVRSFRVLPGVNWRNAIHQWVDYMWGIEVSYQVVAETPSEDGRSEAAFKSLPRALRAAVNET